MLGRVTSRSASSSLSSALLAPPPVLASSEVGAAASPEAADSDADPPFLAGALAAFGLALAFLLAAGAGSPLAACSWSFSACNNVDKVLRHLYHDQALAVQNLQLPWPQLPGLHLPWRQLPSLHLRVKSMCSSDATIQALGACV